MMAVWSCSKKVVKLEMGSGKILSISKIKQNFWIMEGNHDKWFHIFDKNQIQRKFVEEKDSLDYELELDKLAAGNVINLLPILEVK